MATSTYLRDKDRVVSWALAGFVGVSLSVGAWFFSGLRTEMVELRGAVQALTTKVAVMGVESRRIDALERDLDTLEARVRALETR